MIKKCENPFVIKHTTRTNYRKIKASNYPPRNWNIESNSNKTSRGMLEFYFKSKSPYRSNDNKYKRKLSHLQTYAFCLSQDKRLSHNCYISRPIFRHKKPVHNNNQVHAKSDRL